jgi:hypothetical protein
MGWEMCFVIFARSAEIVRIIRYLIRLQIGVQYRYEVQECDANAAELNSAAGNKELRTTNYKLING